MNPPYEYRKCTTPPPLCLARFAQARFRFTDSARFPVYGNVYGLAAIHASHSTDDGTIGVGVGIGIGFPKPAHTPQARQSAARVLQSAQFYRHSKTDCLGDTVTTGSVAAGHGTRGPPRPEQGAP